MSSQRAEFRVTTKAALYTPDRTKVLVTIYVDDGVRFITGLPGGHMDAGETPDWAMQRELREELGLDGVELVQSRFWMHQNGKLVLGFTGVIDESTNFTLQEEELIEARWVLVDDIVSGVFDLGSYGDFVIDSR